ncbi:DHCW motif cupin fold protein [bacterium]|nr:DHCW motif cupin fold protein [bacterium]NUN47042.1 DHCW motif cupin fold protein [bacterium]
MRIENAPFQVFDLSNTSPVTHQGETGQALWQTVSHGNVRMRIVTYSPGYLADHWCEKGHAVFVLEGAFVSELQDGRRFELTQGMSYIVADHAEPHRSYSASGVKLLIVD